MTARKPNCCKAHGACSREDPEPKLRPLTRTLAAWCSGLFSTKSGFGDPSGRNRQSKNRPASKPVRAMLLRNCLGMIWSVSTSTRSSGATRPVWRVNGSIASAPIPLANVDEVAGDRGGGGHRRAHQVRTATFALASLEVAIRRAGAAFARLQDVGVHAQAHAAASLAPFETSLGED